MDNSTTATSVTSINDAESTTAVWNTTMYDAPIEYKQEWQLLQAKMNRAQIFICPTLLLVGLLGNSCIILTVTHVKFRQVTSRYILCALAFSDSLLLLTNPFNQQFMRTVWHGGDIRAISIIGCKIFITLYRFAKASSSWCVVLVAVERFIAVIFPLKAKTLVTRRTMLAAIATVYIFLISVHSIRSITAGIVNGICRPDFVTPDTKDLHKISIVIGATLYSLAPMTILLSVTPPIIISLVKSHRMRQLLVQGTNERSTRDTSRISIMLIGVVVSYIVWVTPITLTVIIATATNQPIFGSKKVGLIILQGIALTFEQLNHSCNFIIYIMFSTQFRRRFVNMIPCGRSCSSRGMIRNASSAYSVNSTLALKSMETESSTMTCQED